MIISESAESYRMITQNDHGDLAGQFAAHWGNQQFAKLNPYQPMVLAAEAHDNGWWDWDIHPAIDDDGVPITFTRTPREFRSEFYGKGIDNVIGRDLYAGLMVSMHGTGLNQKRYGTMPSMVQRDDEYSKKFVAEREPTHEGMISKLHNMEAYALVTSKEQIWHNYLMMQVFDRLSLFFCSNFDILTVAKSGSHTKEGGSYYGPSIKPTPVKLGQPEIELTLQVVDSQTVILDPYPFDESPLHVNVRGKLVPNVKYKSQEEFREVYAKAERQLFEFTVRSR
ncbi:MAG: DUF3891 family protein [Deltaproteobacteria bacterium]|nr:DUF3891 family protein [Deltaproteobacteria bacterium]